MYDAELRVPADAAQALRHTPMVVHTSTGNPVGQGSPWTDQHVLPLWTVALPGFHPPSRGSKQDWWMPKKHEGGLCCTRDTTPQSTFHGMY